jgi:hypothetical protein
VTLGNPVTTSTYPLASSTEEPTNARDRAPCQQPALSPSKNQTFGTVNIAMAGVVATERPFTLWQNSRRSRL